MRTLGSLFLFLAGAAALLDYAFARADGQAFRLHPLGEMWFKIHQESSLLVEPAIARHVHPLVWDWIVGPAWLTPAVALFGGLGVLFWLMAGAFRRRRGAY